MSAPDRRAKLDRDHPSLSVRRQCAMLGLARSSVYRLPHPANDDDIALMRRNWAKVRQCRCGPDPPFASGAAPTTSGMRNFGVCGGERRPDVRFCGVGAAGGEQGPG